MASDAFAALGIPARGPPPDLAAAAVATAAVVVVDPPVPAPLGAVLKAAVAGLVVLRSSLDQLIDDSCLPINPAVLWHPAFVALCLQQRCYTRALEAYTSRDLNAGGGTVPKTALAVSQANLLI